MIYRQLRSVKFSKLQKIYIIAFLVALFISNEGLGQDPIFSQFYAAPLQINPAFAGNTFNPRISLNYRDQWRNFNNAFSTTSISFEKFVPEISSGFGIVLSNDRAGDGIYTTNMASLIYSYKLQATKTFFIKWGFEVSYFQNKVDWDRLVLPIRLIQ